MLSALDPVRVYQDFATLDLISNGRAEIIAGRHARQAVDIHRAAGERAGHPEKLRVGISTHFNAGADPRSAREVFPYYHEYLRPKTPGGRGFLISRAAFDAGARPGQAIMIGSAAELIDKILDAHRLLGIDRFFAQFDWGGLPRHVVEYPVHRHATEIGTSRTREHRCTAAAGLVLRVPNR